MGSMTCFIARADWDCRQHEGIDSGHRATISDWRPWCTSEVSSDLHASRHAQEASRALEDARNAAKAAAAQRDEALQERDALASDKATLGRHLDAANARLTAVGSSHPSKCGNLLAVVLTCSGEQHLQVCAFVHFTWTCRPCAGVRWHHRTAGTCARHGAAQTQSTPRSDPGLSCLPVLAANPVWIIPGAQTLLGPCFTKAAC